MAVKELRIVEERCDRCELLISKKNLGASGEVVGESEQAKNTGSFVLVSPGGDEAGDTVVVEYGVVCDRCRSLLESLIKKMGKVNRGTRNRAIKKAKMVEKTEEGKTSKRGSKK